MSSIAGRFLSAAAVVLLIAGCSGMQNGAIPAAGSAAQHQLHGFTGGVPASSTETLLHNFASSDGASPYGELIKVGGALYGTTIDGGANGYGEVFKITPSGNLTVLYSFAGGASDGGYPYGGLINVKGTLYGTTLSSGGLGCYSSGCGTVYKITTAGKESIVYSFNGGTSDGAFPEAPLVDVAGTLYGTTTQGGTGNHGTVFKVTTSGKETLLYSFAGGNDGATPLAGLTDLKGTLYGTTEVGGSGPCSGFQGVGCGTVFSVTTSGKESVIHTFAGYSGDGEFPFAGLTVVKNTLYGTTLNGGTSNIGIVFKMTAGGTETILYNFKNSTSDGNEPYATLLNIKGTLYGTTGQGGTASVGTVYKITTSGTESVLYSFAGYPVDGTQPVAGLTKVGHALYGTTNEGGNSKNCYSFFGPIGCGTVFSVSL